MSVAEAALDSDVLRGSVDLLSKLSEALDIGGDATILSCLVGSGSLPLSHARTRSKGVRS
jgi:hypothetical protein